MSAFSFVDKMSANEPPIRVRALLSFLSTEEGGRQTPAFSGYRPNHNFGEASGREFYIGQRRKCRVERPQLSKAAVRDRAEAFGELPFVSTSRCAHLTDGWSGRAGAPSAECRAARR